MRKWVQSSIRAVGGWQTVMQEDSIEALHQYWDPLVQVAGLSSLARVERDPPSEIILLLLSLIIVINFQITV